MKNKLWRIGRLLYAFIFMMALFTLLRILAQCFYAAKMNNGDYTIGMMLMDKAHKFNLTSYISGWLHCGVVGMMLKIILDK